MTEQEFGKMTTTAMDYAFTLGHPKQVDRWEGAFTEEFIQAVQTAHTFIDCGAEYGFYTRLALLHGPKAIRITAFEPELDRYNALRDLFDAFKNITVSGYALAEVEGRGLFYKPAAGVSMSIAGGMHVTGESRFLHCVSLDSRVTGPVDVVKMDIEGGEDLAIRGMRVMLAQREPMTLFIEFHPPQDDVARKETLTILRAAGFRVRYISGDSYCGRAVMVKP